MPRQPSATGRGSRCLEPDDARAHLLALADLLVVADELQRIPLWVMEVQRADLWPGVLGRPNVEPESLEPRQLRFIVLEVDVQGDVMQRRLIRAERLGLPLQERPLAGVEEREVLRMPPYPSAISKNT